MDFYAENIDTFPAMMESWAWYGVPPPPGSMVLWSLFDSDTGISKQSNMRNIMIQNQMYVKISEKSTIMITRVPFLDFGIMREVCRIIII